MRVAAQAELWPIAGAFTISRGSKTQAEVVVVRLEDEGYVGRGEAVPYKRFGETTSSVLAEIECVAGEVVAGLDRQGLLRRLPPGAARNALDLALWDMKAKKRGEPVWKLARLSAPAPVKTAFTISLDTPEAMAEAARREARRPLLKLKIGGPNDLARVEAVRAAAPRTRLILDANEGLSFDDLVRLTPDLHRLGVLMIEQPLRQADDAALEAYDGPIQLCADESLHTRAELEACKGRYSMINVKLDKAGGLTEAIALIDAARAMGLEIMIGCMVSTSLAVAPAMLLTSGAAFVDLDGPLLLAKDREPGLRSAGSILEPAPAELWG
ncbi:MAG: N-acetyl-D-Glu racemase DgcA [Caulobacteraceae bacterium]